MTAIEPTLYPYVSRYLAERRQRGEIARISLDSLWINLRQFADSFGQRPLQQLGPAALDRYLKSIGRYADSTKRTKVSAVKGFARWLTAKRIIQRDFTAMAPRIRVARRVPRDLTADHFTQVLNAATESRARLALWLMFGCGLRCVEISRLDVRDYDPMNALLYVKGKGMHERVVPVLAPVARAIEYHLAEHPAQTGPLLRPLTGALRPLSPSRISHFATDAIRESGVKLRQGDGRSAHGFRAAAASDLYDVCRDPRIVQEFLGHAHLQTTTIYLRRAGTERVREALEGRAFA